MVSQELAIATGICINLQGFVRFDNKKLDFLSIDNSNKKTRASTPLSHRIPMAERSRNLFKLI